MDILSHGLWAGAAAKVFKKKSPVPINIKQAAFWGVFPDLLAFTAPFSILITRLVTARMKLADWPRPNVETPGAHDALNIFNHTQVLYSLGHSAIVFLIIFGLIAFVRKRPPLAMGAWLLHILIDIPTHTSAFYPTPFLWPISDFKISGISWATPWFLALNYSAILIVYWLLRKKST